MNDIVTSNPLGPNALPAALMTSHRTRLRAVSIARTSLGQQTLTVSREESMYFRAQHEANTIVAAVAEFEDIIPDLTALRLEEGRRKKLSAQLSIKRETTAAGKMEDRQRSRAHVNAEAFSQSCDKSLRQVEAATQGHRTASARVAKTGQALRDASELLDEARRRQHDDRVQAVLELKANTDAATAQLRGANERLARKREEKATQESKEFDDILKMGGNPYVEFKRREVEKQAILEEKKERARIKEQQLSLAKKMVIEDDYNRKKELQEKREKAYEDAYRGEQGTEIIEARNRQYLMEKTTNHTDLIDPTRRMYNIEPSQVTTIQDASFGLGYNPRKDRAQLQDVIDMVSKKYPAAGLGEYARLVPKKLESASGPAVDDERNGATGLDGLVEPSSRLPGKDAFIINKLGSSAADDDYDVDATTSGSKGGHSAADSRATTPGAFDSTGGKSKAFEIPKKTKFEEDALRKAQAKAKSRLEEGTPQVAGGRTFKGQSAFVAKPDTIVFKDFVVGKVYHRKILLTNVSLTFNSFKILDLPESITDFFEIKYERPGRMSAGMAVLLDICFTPKVNEDIISDLSFLSSTGPFAVPIRCLTQKVTPSVNTTTIRFDNIVMGEKHTFGLKIINDGAKATSYYFVDPETGQRIPNYDDGHRGGDNISKITQSPRLQPGESNSADQQQRTVPQFDDDDDDDDASPRAEEIVYCKNDKELLDRAAAVGEACLEYPPGRTALQYATIGNVGSYSDTVHNITFAPLAPGYFREERILHFEGTDETINITIVATSIKVPIYVAEPVVDLQCCVYGKLYRKKVVIKNRGKISFKAYIKPPPELKGFVEFNPDMGFIQPDADFEMQMKFRPTEEMLARCGKYAMPGSEVIAVPMLVHVPDQALPVYYTLYARLTTGEVSFSENAIDFGDCYTTQSCMKVIKLKNESKLSQRFGFVHLRNEVEVQPNDGFGVLLPREEKEIQVFLKPSSATFLDFNLNCQTSMNITRSIKIKCQGVEPPLKLTHTVLKFASCCPGDQVTHSIFATNTSSTRQTFEFVVPRPAVSYIRISPNVETLEPGASCRLEIEYFPPASLLPSGDEGGGAAAEGEEAKSSDAAAPYGGAALLSDLPFYEGVVSESKWKEEEESSDGETEPEPWSIHSRWSLPCFIQSGGGGKKQSVQPPLFVDVHTTLVKRILEVDIDRIVFGQLAVGQVKVLPIRVRNLGSVDAELLAEGLNSAGAFSVVNALKPVPANSFLQILLQFAPIAQGVRSETLTLRCPTLGKTLTIVLKGEGVSPVLVVEPHGTLKTTVQGDMASITLIENWTTSGPALKHVLAGDTGRASVTLRNSSVFPLRYVLESLQRPHENYNHKSVFSCIPPEADINPGQELKVDILFSPDHERVWAYEQQIKISVPNQTEDHVLHLKGRCWNRQVYAVANLAEDDAPARLPVTTEDRFALPSALRLVENRSAQALGIMLQKRPSIVLKFPRVDDKNAPKQKRKITVGCTALNDPKKGTPGTYEIEFTPEAKALGYFTALPDKGAVAMGAESEVEFQFNPPVVDVQGGLVVGQWTRVVAKCTCKGGFKPDGDEPDRVFDIVLEGYVQV